MGSFNRKLHNLQHKSLYLLNPVFHQNSLCGPLIPEKFDSSHYNETDLFQKIESHGKIKNLYLIFSAFELGFGDTVADLDLAKIDRYYKDNVTSLGKKSFRCCWRPNIRHWRMLETPSWRQFMLATSLRCWWPISTLRKSPTYCCHQY